MAFADKISQEGGNQLHLSAWVFVSFGNTSTEYLLTFVKRMHSWYCSHTTPNPS